MATVADTSSELEGREAEAEAFVTKDSRPQDFEQEKRKRIKERMKPDEHAMTVGIVNIMITAFIVGRWPQSFFVLHLIKTAVLLPWRFVRFRRQKYQWYMVEFCYFVSYATFIGCFMALIRTSTGFESSLTDYNGLLFRVGFSFATGPLVWSVIIFKNSIVLHDIDQLTSLFIHISPPLLFWCWRWGGGLGPSAIGQTWPGMLSICGNPHELDPSPNATAIESLHETFEKADACTTSTDALWCDTCTANVWELVVVPQIIYMLAWAIPYYLLVFCCAANCIEQGGYDTLYLFTLKSNAAVKRFVDLAPCQGLRPIFYIMVHQASALFFGSLSMIWWHSFALHTIFLGGMLFVSCYNGATYTFRVFLSRYERNLLKKHPSINQIQAHEGNLGS